MKTSYFLVLAGILVATTNAYGQQTSAYQFSDVQVGLFYSYDQNVSGDHSTAFDQGSGFYNSYDRSNFTVGLTAAFYLNKSFALRSGISYADKSYSGSFYCIYCNYIATNKKVDLQFIQVPMALRVYPYNQKISFFGEIGMVNQFMTGKPSAYNLQGNTYSISGLAGAGLAYEVGRGYSVQLSAEYTKGLSKILKHSDYPYRALGFRAAITKKL